MVGVNSETLWRWLAGGRRRRAVGGIIGRRKSSSNRRKKNKRDEKNQQCSKAKDEETTRRRTDEGDDEVRENTVRRRSEEEEEALRLKMNGRKDEEEEDDDEEDEEENEEERRKERDVCLSRITHLHLENKGITHVENVGACGGALVAYLQHNHLTKLSNLRPLRLLQELYLHDNHINRLECLQELVCLRRLLVPGNRIGVVEGLPGRLQELHIQNQRLPPGDSLVLDPQALAAMQDTLRVLDVSGNRLTEMGAVGLLTRLQVLRASENQVCSLRHVTAVVGRLRQVREVTLVGNPVTAHRRYRPALVLAASHTLEMLDERVVTSLCREFLIQAHRHKTMLRSQQCPPKLPPPPPPPAAHSQEVGKGGGNHLLFTPVTPVDHAHDLPATGPRYVLGALRRPEFDLILKLSQRRARQHRVVHESEDDAELDYRTYASGQRDSSGDDNDEFTDTDNNRTGTTKGTGGRGARWSSPSSSYTGRVGMIAHERSVWFADEEDDDEEAQFTEELPRLVPRPYWRNKSPVSRVTR